MQRLFKAYTQQRLLDYIQRATAKELHRIFGPYQPGLTEQDYYELELGTAGLMRGYMANPCTADFPLERKLEIFLTLALRGYKVPEDIKAVAVPVLAHRLLTETDDYRQKVTSIQGLLQSVAVPTEEWKRP